jgi:hypothetical protein
MNTWEARAAMPTRRSAMATGTLGGRIYVIGGEVPSLQAVNEVYDPVSNTWSTDTPIPVARHGFAAIPLSCGLLLPGGGTIQGLQPTTRVDLFEPMVPGDLDGDQQVGLGDLAILLSNFGTPSGAEPGDGDSDEDGDVDLQDLASLLADYGRVCA